MNQEQKVVLRDAAIFAFKLWLDGIKDVVLAFLGLGAAAVDVLAGKPRSGYRFHKVMKLGQRVDAAIDVYGPYDDKKKEQFSGTIGNIKF